MGLHIARILPLVSLSLSMVTGGAVFALQSGAGAELPVAPKEGGPRAWEVTGISGTLNVRQEPSTSSTVIDSLRAGALLKNLGGCRQAEGRVWCDVQRLSGGVLGYVAADYLRPARGPDGTIPRGADDSALRAGRREFDATGQASCAQHSGQPATSCDFGVARAGGGYATVVVTKPDGAQRMLYFSLGIPVGADNSQADQYGEFKAEREGDTYVIRVGEERYELPESTILGG